MPEPKYILTATSRTGAKVNPITGAATDTITVYGDADLKRRLDAAKTDPRQLDITYRKV
jgi:hypothetical protein